MFTEFKQIKVSALGKDCEETASWQEETIENYIKTGAFAFSVHLETSPNFRKILMNLASERGHSYVVRYCLLKAKQHQAQKDAQEEEEYRRKYPYHPTDAQLLRQECTKQALIHAEAELHALRAKMLWMANPDDPGLRVVYERMLAGATMNERTVKEIKKFLNPFVYDGLDGNPTESTKRKDALVMLRCEHFDALAPQYKGPMGSDAGALAIVSWLSRRKREAFFGTRAWMLKMNDATGRTVALTSTLERYAIHLADEPDGKSKVGYSWDFSGQPKSFREEMMESYKLMINAIDNGWIACWSFGLVGKWGDSTGPRIVSETTLTNGRKMAITLPAPLYWRVFFELEKPQQSIDVFSDAWIGAATLYELTRYHVALIQAGVYKRCSETAWLDVLACEDGVYDDDEDEDEDEDEVALPVASPFQQISDLDSLRVLPGWHITEAMMLAKDPTAKALKGPNFNFTLAQAWQQNGRHLMREIDRSALKIVPSHSWSLEEELDLIRDPHKHVINEYCGKATVFSNLPDTLAIDIVSNVKQAINAEASVEIGLPMVLDFNQHSALLKQGVEARCYELVGVIVVERGRGGVANEDFAWIRAPKHAGGEWYMVGGTDYRFYRGHMVLNAPPVSVTISCDIKARSFSSAVVYYRQKERMHNESRLMEAVRAKWEMRVGSGMFAPRALIPHKQFSHGLTGYLDSVEGAWCYVHAESILASVPAAQQVLFEATTSGSLFGNHQALNLATMFMYLNEFFASERSDPYRPGPAIELRRRRKVLSRLPLRLVTDGTAREFQDALDHLDATITELHPPPKPEPKASKAPKARKPPPPKPTAAPKLTKKERDQEAERLARQLQEACAAEREQRLVAAKKAEAEKKVVEDTEREEKRKHAEAERIRAEAIALEEAEGAEEAAKKVEELRVQQLRESRAAEHLEHAKAQQQKRDPNATDLQRQLAADAQAAADAEKEAARVAKLAVQQREAQAVHDEAYANDYDARMQAKAAEVAAKKAATKAKKEAEKAVKQAKDEAAAVVAEQRRREEQAWATAQAAPAAVPVADPAPDSAAPADCIICMETKATHVIVPCGHFCLCARCASNQTQCPLCRAPAVHIIQGFF